MQIAAEERVEAVQVLHAKFSTVHATGILSTVGDTLKLGKTSSIQTTVVQKEPAAGDNRHSHDGHRDNLRPDCLANRNILAEKLLRKSQVRPIAVGFATKSAAMVLKAPSAATSHVL